MGERAQPLPESTGGGRLKTDRPDTALGRYHPQLGEVPPFFMPPDLIYIECPGCGRRIKEPFVRGSGPVAYVHRHERRRNARLVVVPAVEGDEHEVYQVAGDESIESVLVRVLEAVA